MQGLAPIEERFPRPSVMGVVNVTPDSFSDGGVHFQPEDAVAAGLQQSSASEQARPPIGNPGRTGDS